MQASLSFETFKSGPLRPYIAVTLYHELNHLLVRKTKEAPLGECDKYFITKSNSVGNCIAEKMRDKFIDIP